MGRARIFTPEALVSIPVMVESGLRAAEIAERLGTTPKSLRVVCSRNGIPLRKSFNGMKRKVVFANTTSEAGRDDNVVTVALPPSVRLSLSREAQRRETLPQRLIERLFGIIAQDELYDAVLGTPPRKEAARRA